MTWRTLATLMLISVSIAGCATSVGTCDWGKPIRPSRSDVLTRQTANQILAHNETGARLCGWK